VPGMPRVPWLPVLAGVLACAVALGAQVPSAPDRARTAQRAGERLRELVREADALAAQQSKLLVEVETLDKERRAKAADLQRIERELAEAERQLAETTARAGDLQRQAEAQRPDAEARLVQLYKLGRAGYWRMLLDVDDLRLLGRAYRTAAAMTAIDRQRVEAHQRTLQALEKERNELQTRTAMLGQLHADARNARAAADRAIAAHTAMLDAIDARRDLNAQMTGDLQVAQERLQASLEEAGGNGTPVNLPLRSFRGALPWPARGRLQSRFGREASSRFGTAVVRNGIEIAVAQGQRVGAVHEGTVAYADKFTGYGTLVIVEHGEGAYSLYGHLDSAHVARGDYVRPGTPVGVAGRNPSGNLAVYFELRIDGRPVDPLQWLEKGNP
jgi:septal ring factor EnvC (AmiA/AmiB activator)